MEKKDIDWGNLGFGYVPTDKRFVANYKDGAWDEGALVSDSTITISECAGVLQYGRWSYCYLPPRFKCRAYDQFLQEITDACIPEGKIYRSC